MNPDRYSMKESHPAVDAALRRLGSATPDPAMNERLLRELRRAANQPQRRQLGWFGLAGRGQRLAAVLAGGFACTLIIVGSVEHSRHVAVQSAPVLQVFPQQSGVGTASAAHIAAHPEIAPTGHGRAAHRTNPGRANLAPGAHPRAGVAVPAQSQ